MSLLNSFIFQLFGRKPVFKCSVCGKTGKMFVESDVVGNGQFKAVGKAKSGHIILECIDCKRRFYFDPIFGGETLFKSGAMGDLLDFVAKEELKEELKDQSGSS